MLLEKGPAYQNDITEITYHIRGNGIESFRKKFKFHLPQAIMDLSCWYYEYYDLIEKKLNHVKSICHIVISIVEDLLLFMTKLINTMSDLMRLIVY